MENTKLNNYTKQELQNLVQIGLCQPKFYKRTVWLKAKAVMERAAVFGLVKPFDFGRGKGKYIANAPIDTIVTRLVTNSQ